MLSVYLKNFRHLRTLMLLNPIETDKFLQYILNKHVSLANVVNPHIFFVISLQLSFKN